MKTLLRAIAVSLVSGLAAALSPEAAHAYGGPGSVITGIGALLAALAAVAAAVLGFLWFPVKKLLGKMRRDGEGPEADPSEPQEGAFSE